MAVFVFEEDAPTWDFWQYDRDGDSFTEAARDLADLGDPFYDPDFQKWVNRPVWTREEAAALTFGRDPDAINTKADHEDTEDSRKQKRSVFLRFAISELESRIKCAQDLQLLPLQIPPAKYVSWARLFGIDHPWELRSDLTSLEDPIHRGDVSFSISKRARGSDQVRKDNNLLKMILALVLMEAGQDPIDVALLAKKIEKRLTDLSTPEKPVFFKRQTIESRLWDAAELLGDELDMHFLNYSR